MSIARGNALSSRGIHAEGRAAGNLLDGLRLRFVDAHRHLEDLLGRDMPRTAIGRRVGHFAGRTGFSSKVVGGWYDGGQEPELALKIVIARALDVDPGWLWFGEESAAPAPEKVSRSPIKRDELWFPESARGPLRLGQAIRLDAENSRPSEARAAGGRAGRPGRPRRGVRGES